MAIAIAADHGGVHLKNTIGQYLVGKGYQVIDLGTWSDDAVDYPDYARAVAQAILSGEAERAVLICGSGVGAGLQRTSSPESGRPSATTVFRLTRALRTTT